VTILDGHMKYERGVGGLGDRGHHPSCFAAFEIPPNAAQRTDQWHWSRWHHTAVELGPGSAGALRQCWRRAFYETTEGSGGYRALCWLSDAMHTTSDIWTPRMCWSRLSCASGRSELAVCRLAVPLPLLLVRALLAVSFAQDYALAGGSDPPSDARRTISTRMAMGGARKVCFSLPLTSPGEA